MDECGCSDSIPFVSLCSRCRSSDSPGSLLRTVAEFLIATLQQRLCTTASRLCMRHRRGLLLLLQQHERMGG